MPITELWCFFCCCKLISNCEIDDKSFQWGNDGEEKKDKFFAY